ncbi:MAG: hypothetical protein ABFS23_07605 [Pseudomonadota bacterium]
MFAMIAVIGAMVTYEIINASKPSEQAPPLVVPDLIDAETLPVVEKAGDFVVTEQDTSGFPEGQWTGNQQLFVATKAAGQSLSLGIPARDPGSYHLTGYFTKSYDYGTLQIFVNDEKTGAPVDLWSYSIESTGPVPLGVVRLTGEDDVIRIEVEGKNEKASAPYYQFGLDGFVFRAEDGGPATGSEPANTSDDSP